MGAVVSVAAAIASVVHLARTLFSRPPATPPPQVEKAAPDQKAEMIREARQQMGVDCLNHYNFGVCGQSGVGKSSFINGLLGLEGYDAASVGEVETTQKVQRYSTKTCPYLKVWDIPGAGTTNHPAKTYFEDKKLFVFDAILILSSDRFLEVDFEILRSARKYSTPCVFVRTKCDIGVQAKAKREGITMFEASQRFRNEVNSSFLACLEKTGLKDSAPPPKLFFISNEFFWDDEVYVLYGKKGNLLDASLSSMDERKLISFIYETAKIRSSSPK